MCVPGTNQGRAVLANALSDVHRSTTTQEEDPAQRNDAPGDSEQDVEEASQNRQEIRRRTQKTEVPRQRSFGHDAVENLGQYQSAVGRM